MFELEAGILVASVTCPHCSHPTDGPSPLRCACAGMRDPRGPRHGLAEAFLPFSGQLHA